MKLDKSEKSLKQCATAF